MIVFLSFSLLFTNPLFLFILFVSIVFSYFKIFSVSFFSAVLILFLFTSDNIKF